MTVPELIHNVLGAVRNQFYCDLPERDFARDLRYLEAAVATYAYECQQRGWLFQADFLQKELLGLLHSFKRSGVEVQWMPLYLQNAIRRHIGQRAEELQAAARSVPKAATRIVNGVKPMVVLEKSDTEVLATLYNDVRRMRRQSLAARKAKPASARQQGRLL